MAIVQEQTGDEQIKQVSARPTKLKKSLSVRGFVNSPYLFILAPLIVGGLYLVQHPELVRTGINNPYATTFVLAIPVAAFASKLVFNFFSVIEQWIRIQFEHVQQSKKGYFFEIVTAVFMFVSVCEAGPFFNDIQHNVLNGVLGYVTVLAFDLIAVVCIDARRKELAKGGTKSGIYLAGVMLCAAVSMVANLYSALENFKAPAGASIPDLLKTVAPYVGIMFPIMIVFLAFSRDTEIEIDDAEAYRKQQQKRVDFLVVRREILASITHELEQIELLKKREFFLKSIFFTKKKIAHAVEMITAKVIDQVHTEIKTLKAEVQQKEQSIATQAQTIQTLSQKMEQMAATCEAQCHQVADQMGQLAHFREELQVSFEQMTSQFQQHSSQQNEGYHSSFSTQYDQDILQIKQLLSDRIDSTFAGMNQQINDRIDQGFSQIKELIPPTYTSTYPADPIDSHEALDQVLHDYPIVLQWQSTAVKTVSIEDIVKGTGLSPQRVRKAEKDGVFSGTRREGYYRIGSVIAWLKTVPSSKIKDKISSPTSGQLSAQNTEEIEAKDTGYLPQNVDPNEDLAQVFEMPEVNTIG
jgi:hypothetical protein